MESLERVNSLFEKIFKQNSVNESQQEIAKCLLLKYLERESEFDNTDNEFEALAKFSVLVSSKLSKAKELDFSKFFGEEF